MEAYRTDSTPQPKNKIWLACGGCLLGLTLLLCLGLGAAALFFWQESGEAIVTQVVEARETVLAGEAATPTRPATSTPVPPLKPSRTPVPNTLTDTLTPPPETPETAVKPLPIPVPESIIQIPIPASAYRELEKLFSTHFPPHDYFDTANRLGKQGLTERTVTAPVYRIGDEQTFFSEEGSVKATLVAATANTYFWVENGLYLPEKAVAEAANRLENEYYPLLLNLFGPVWQPGVDNDPRFSVVHLRLPVNASELGYFSGVDAYPRALFRNSNQQEVVYLNMSAMEVGEDLYYGTLVHEVQHLIQWHVDPNEKTWLNEGLSQLAEIYVGLDTADTYYYERRPHTRLNAWDYDEELIDAHYAAAYLFTVYLWEQLGETAVQELSRHPANGMSSVRAVLAGYDARSLEDFVADWAIANYLDNPDAGDAYNYRNLDPGTPDLQMRIRQFSYERIDTLPQFGVHYYALTKTGKTTISFAGDTLADLLAETPLSGRQVWFAPPMDETSATLTLRYDLRDLAEATLRFHAWYDLEEDWDFAYMVVSIDNGRSWDLLTGENMGVGEYGPAFTGSSAAVPGAFKGWVQEAISLHRYVGQEVLVRFEVLTDSSLLGRGFALDKIHVPQMGAIKALETAVSGWEAAGFVQTTGQLPQQWRLQLIQNGPTPQVVTLPLNTLNQGQWTVELGPQGGVLVIVPLTPFTEDVANYWLAVE
jgi:immune inhibitor A